MEFVFLIGLSFLILLVFVGSIRYHVVRAGDAGEYARLKDLTYALQSEINRVGTLDDSYARTFDVPATVDNTPVTVSIPKNGTLLVNTSGYEFYVSILPLTGELKIGDNTIYKQNNQIFLT